MKLPSPLSVGVVEVPLPAWRALAPLWLTRVVARDARLYTNTWDVGPPVPTCPDTRLLAPLWKATRESSLLITGFAEGPSPGRTGLVRLALSWLTSVMVPATRS